MNNNKKTAKPIISGTVKWFDPLKGYGFITTDDGEDVYVNTKHIDTARTYTGYEVGDKVTFVLNHYPNAKNASASHVNLVEQTTEAVAEETTKEE